MKQSCLACAGRWPPLRDRAPFLEYDFNMAVLRTMIAGRDLAELLAERMKRVNGLALTEASAVVEYLGCRRHLD